MNNLYFWVDDVGIIETYTNVKDISYIDDTLSFICDDGDVEMKGINETPLLADKNTKITKDNYKKYILTPDEEFDCEREINKLKQEINELKNKINQLI